MPQARKGSSMQGTNTNGKARRQTNCHPHSTETRRHVHGFLHIPKSQPARRAYRQLAPQPWWRPKTIVALEQTSELFRRITILRARPPLLLLLGPRHGTYIPRKKKKGPMSHFAMPSTKMFGSQQGRFLTVGISPLRLKQPGSSWHSMVLGYLKFKICLYETSKQLVPTGVLRNHYGIR